MDARRAACVVLCCAGGEMRLRMGTKIYGEVGMRNFMSRLNLHHVASYLLSPLSVHCASEVPTTRLYPPRYLLFPYLFKKDPNRRSHKH